MNNGCSESNMTFKRQKQKYMVFMYNLWHHVRYPSWRRMVTGKKRQIISLTGCTTIIYFVVLYVINTHWMNIYLGDDKPLLDKQCYAGKLRDFPMRGTLKSIQKCERIIFTSMFHTGEALVWTAMRRQSNQYNISLKFLPNWKRLVNVSVGDKDAKDYNSSDGTLVYFYIGPYFHIRDSSLPIPLYVGLIQNPIQHLVARFNYMRKEDKQNMTLEGCVQRYMSTHNETCLPTGGGVITFLCGETRICYGNDPIRITKARSHLLDKYLFVGTTDNIREYLEALSLAFPHLFPTISRKFTLEREKEYNASLSSEPTFLSSSSRSFLNRLLRDEYELYNTVRISFQYMLTHLRKLTKVAVAKSKALNVQNNDNGKQNAVKTKVKVKVKKGLKKDIVDSLDYIYGQDYQLAQPFQNAHDYYNENNNKQPALQVQPILQVVRQGQQQPVLQIVPQQRQQQAVLQLVQQQPVLQLVQQQDQPVFQLVKPKQSQSGYQMVQQMQPGIQVNNQPDALQRKPVKQILVKSKIKVAKHINNLQAFTDNTHGNKQKNIQYNQDTVDESQQGQVNMLNIYGVKSMSKI